MQHEERRKLAQVAGRVDENLAQAGAIFYDCEIVAMIPVDSEPRDNTLFYCGGWDDHANMGISVVSAYDFVNRAYRIFLQDNLDQLRSLIESRDIIIGYNNQRFDDKLLAANDIKVTKQKSWDLWKAIVDTQPPGQRAGFNLNKMLVANKLEEKSGEGGMAPVLAQKGHWGRLINYCLDDTRLSVQLLRLACNDVMVHPKNGGYMTIEKPWDAIKVSAEKGLF